MSISNSVVIAGAGITGAFTAYFLARQGVDVIVVDPFTTDGRASYNNPGGINPLHGPGIPGAMSGFAMHCYHAHLAEWESIRELSSMEFNGRITSRIILAFDDKDSNALAKAERLYRQAPGFTSEWLGPGALREVDPHISSEAIAGLLTHGNATVDAAGYTRAVLAAAQELGATVKPGHVEGIEHIRYRVNAVMLESERLECDELVIATGTWPDRFSDDLGVALPVDPVAGDLLLVQREAAVPCHDVTWRHHGVYYHADNLFWVGGTFRSSVVDACPSEAARQTVIENAAVMFPELESCPVVRHVCGLRPMTPDGLPICGRLPGYQNVLVALGGGSKGMLLSSGLGMAVARAITGGSSDVPDGFLNPQRFPAQSRSHAV